MADKHVNRLNDMAFGKPRVGGPNEDAFSSNRDIVPIFVIGTFRSGTTSLRYILDSHSRISCPPESKFLEPLASLYNSEISMKAFRHMGYEELFVKRKIREFADAFFIGNVLARPDGQIRSRNMFEYWIS